MGRRLLERQRPGRLSRRSTRERGRRVAKARTARASRSRSGASQMSTSNDGYYQSAALRNEHGPYLADDFKAGVGAPNVTVSKSATIRMDALASTDHIGLIYANNADGTDQIIEAKGEAYGTNIWTRTYRGELELQRRPPHRLELRLHTAVTRRSILVLAALPVAAVGFTGCFGANGGGGAARRHPRARGTRRARGHRRAYRPHGNFRASRVASLEPGSAAHTCIEEHIPDAQFEGSAVLRVGVASESLTFREAGGRSLRGCVEHSRAARRETTLVRRLVRAAAGGTPRRSATRVASARRATGRPVGFAWFEASETSALPRRRAAWVHRGLRGRGRPPGADGDGQRGRGLASDVRSVRARRRGTSAEPRSGGGVRRGLAGGSQGGASVNVAPAPGADSTVSVPPCAAAIARPRASPSPEPGRSSARRTPGSKMRS